MKLQEHKLHHY